jgi:outer membrane protein TolC
MIEAARSRVRLAERDLLPDFEVAANYGFRAGDGMSGGNQPDLASVMVAMNVPIFAKTRQRRAIDQRHAEVLEESYALDDQLAGIRHAITAASADYERARRQAELFEQGIIPQAQQTVASMLAAYQVNSVDFLNLVNAQVMLYDFETQYWKAVVEAEQARARLEAAIGEEQGP